MISKEYELKYAAIISYIAIIINIIAGFLYTPWMISQIGDVDYGIYIIATSILSYFVMDLGLGSATARFISMYLAQGKKESISNFLGLTVKVYLLIDLVILVILGTIILNVDTLFANLSYDQLQKLKMVLIIIGMYSVFSFLFKPLDGILPAYEKYFFLKVCDLLNKVATILFVVVALMYGKGLYALIYANIIVGLVIIIVKFCFVWKKIRVQVNFKYWDKGLGKEIFGFSFWITINSIFNQFIVSIQPTLVGMILGPTETTYFSVGMTIYNYVFTFASVLSNLFLPKISQIVYGAKGVGALENLAIRVGKLQMIVVGGIVVVFASMGNAFMRLWMGSKYEETSYYVTIFLAIPFLIVSSQAIYRTMLTAKGKVFFESFGVVAGAIISVGLSVVLQNRYGVLGAAFGASMGMLCAYVVWLNIVYKRWFDIDVFRFAKRCILPFGLPALVTTVVGRILQYIWYVDTWLKLIIQISICIMVYIAFVLGMTVSSDERRIIIDKIKRSKYE